jgi:hypothetical protein
VRTVRGVVAVLFAGVVALVVVPYGGASFLVARDASDVSLRVQGGRAIVDYRAGGVERHVVLSGAINARQPNREIPQVVFRADYGVGRMRGGTCLPYDGPALAWLLVACKAPDGSYWALQAWQRLRHNFGGTSAPVELQASHWTGPLAQLEVWLDWSFGGRFQHLFGRYTYRGNAVYGFHVTRQGAPLDSYGRNVYLDTYDSGYGAGWRRENGFLTHGWTGTFCYGFYPHGDYPSGAGSAYRITVLGPGVTPIVSWQAPAPGAYDPALDHQLNDLERSFGDPQCRQG